MAIRAQSDSRTRGRADAFLALSRASTRRSLTCRWNNSRWSLGKLFLGQILGLGSKGDMGIDRVALLYPGVAWPAGGLVDAIRSGGCERSLFSRCINGLVWRELCTRQGSA